MGDRNKDWKATTLLIREVCMLKFMEDITNKPEWWRKVYDPNIAARWKHEVLSLNWVEYRKHGDFSKNMAEMVSRQLSTERPGIYTPSLTPEMVVYPGASQKGGFVRRNEFDPRHGSLDLCYQV